VTGFIHERRDWPDFRWEAKALEGRLGAARDIQLRLMARMAGLGFLRAEANLESLTEEILKSHAIEGERLDQAAVRSSIARHLNIDIGALTPLDRHIDGVVEMMLDATERYGEPLTKPRLRRWNAALIRPTSSSMKISMNKRGGWRDDRAGPMQVVSGALGRERVHFEAPTASRLENEMRCFLAWFNAEDGLDSLLKAGLAHLWFVTVHPFDDGNGRIARAITEMQLTRSEHMSQRFYSMSAQIRKERDDYYRQLEAAQRGTLDITGWLDWFIACLGRAMAGADGTLSVVLQKARFWERHAAASFNDRQRLMINRLLDGFEGKLTSSKWAKIAHCSPDTALRDIEDLMRQGVLRKDAAGGRSTGYSLTASE
jgi:Fic family protein